MVLTDILSCERVGVARGSELKTKDAAITRIAELLGAGSGPPGGSSREFYRVLCERESLQSTGIGDGVAIPHGALESLEAQKAALLICPDGVPFDAIDGRPAKILFAVVGPKRATGEHLKTLARVSKLLRDSTFRDKLLASAEGKQAYALIRQAEDGRAA